MLDKIRTKNFDRLIIANLNINSLPSKFDQLKLLIQGKIDILIITETKLDDSFPTEQFTISGYSKPYSLIETVMEEELLYTLEKIYLVSK